MQPNSTHSPRAPNYWGRNCSDQPIARGLLSLSPRSNRAQIGDIQIFLRPIEFRLLHFFMSHPDEVHSRSHLLEEIWGDWIVVGERTVDVHIRRLRITLQPFGMNKCIRTIHCRGYLFDAAARKSVTETSVN
jgi:two-component system, OmpR family, phosphate regulon response regulator PhoB